MTTRDTDDLLRHAVKTVAVHRETHALKAVFCIDRLWSRFPDWADSLRDHALHLQESVFDAPQAEGLMHQQISYNVDRIPERRWRQNVEIGLFPLAYSSIVAWHRTYGIEKIIASYMDSSVATISDLGHSWTIWCSFYEALPYLTDETSKLFLAERFAEFVAQQFHKDGRTLAQSTVPCCDDLESTCKDGSALLSEALQRPGFLGHHLITLATLFRHRSLLSNKQYSVGLSRTHEMIQFHWDAPFLDINLPADCIGNLTDLTDATLEKVLRELLRNGADNVHTLTLADAAATLWDHANDSRRQKLVYYLQNSLQVS